MCFGGDFKSPGVPSHSQILAQHLWRSTAGFSYIEGLIETDTRAARMALAARFGEITLTPRNTPEGRGYHLDATLKTNPAALVQDGRKVCGVGGCGGAL